MHGSWGFIPPSQSGVMADSLTQPTQFGRQMPPARVVNIVSIDSDASGQH